ncbi:MAG: HAD family phosphatase [Chlamydiales bacterium]|nr:HAD family phosphatase [Chlamydiales bacterium]
MKTIQTMYFDLGNVLIFFSHQKMYQQLASISGLSADFLQSIFIQDGLGLQYETGCITTNDFYSHLHKLGNRDFSKEEFVQATSQIFHPNEEMPPIIEEMKQQSIRLILLSNTSECHFNYIAQNYPIIHKFDELVLSYKVGACKPNPMIFQHALKLAECPHSHCFFVDDVLEYVEAARKVGLDSEVFSNMNLFRQHLRDRGLTIC